MSLVTRCPVCSTTFRVAPAQLSARGGRVRCGQCSGVFDGVANLLTEEAVAALPAEPSPQLGLFEGRQSTDSDDALDGVQPAETAPQAQDAPVPTAAQKREGAVQRIERSEKVVVPAFLEPEPPAAGHFVVWSLLAIVALAGLALQAGLHFRSEIGVLLPQSRPYLELACDFLGCDIRLPRRADLLSIESSDLQADGQRPGVIVLNALLRNRAPFAQEYPDLELTLTDHAERAVIRKVLKPRDYLQEKRVALAQGMGGGSEESVRLFLETGGILATGYQLFLFYPCPPPPSSAYWQLSYPSRCQDSGGK
jgi:predicted Zn finger-like uncharacterized protein